MWYPGGGKLETPKNQLKNIDFRQYCKVQPPATGLGGALTLGRFIENVHVGCPLLSSPPPGRMNKQ